MTFVMWMKHFFQSQVKDLSDLKLNQYGKHIIIKQDNTSAIQLERNGRKSSTKRTKHIDVQYFYITDQLKKGAISEVVYKPTEDMLRLSDGKWSIQNFIRCTQTATQQAFDPILLVGQKIL